MINKIVQVAHITEIPGPVQFLARYLSSKTDNFYQIHHPLDLGKKIGSVFLKNDEKIEEKKPAGYLAHYFRTIRWLKRVEKPVDLAIGMNCFDTLPLVVFKKRFKINKVIFFGTDFSRKRFGNPILNYVYVKIDLYCAKKADLVCCNTQRVINQRTKEGVSAQRLVLTPNGVFFDQIGQLPTKKEFEKKLVYIGHLSSAHGLLDVVKSLANTKLRLDIIGSGEVEKELRKIVSEKKLEDQVSFLGKLDHTEVIKYLKNFSGFALAPYTSKNDWTYYCDPVKVKEYLACQVPVIISDVPEIAQTVSGLNLGYVFKDGKELEEALSRVKKLGDDEYHKMIENISNFKKNFDLSDIYKKIIK